MANENNTSTPAPGTARVLPDLTAKAALSPASAQAANTAKAEKGPLVKFNGQKERTMDEERAAWRRRLRRWHRKGVIALTKTGVDSLLTEALTYTQEDTKDDK